ncbi:MAG: hypothetical protein AAF085_00960 [Planctomycetota bacterium]
MHRNLTITKPIAFALCTLSLLIGCRGNQQTDPPAEARVIEQHATTAAIDRIDLDLDLIPDDPAQRNRLLANRWLAIQNAVAHRGTTHRDAFYGSRAYWHTGSTRGIGWALDQQGDLDEAFYIASKGNVRIAGDANQDIEIAGNAVVHILGDLDATLDLVGVCEVVIAGDLTENATIICDGQLELFVGGNSAGILGSTSSSTIVIDGNASGTIQAGEPATTLTVTGDLTADVPAPKNKEAILTLRIGGYCPTAKMLDLATAGFTRVNATLGISDAPAGLYPQGQNATRPVARWVVLRQVEQTE